MSARGAARAPAARQCPPRTARAAPACGCPAPGAPGCAPAAAACSPASRCVVRRHVGRAARALPGVGCSWAVNHHHLREELHLHDQGGDGGARGRRHLAGSSRLCARRQVQPVLVLALRGRVAHWHGREVLCRRPHASPRELCRAHLLGHAPLPMVVQLRLGRLEGPAIARCSRRGRVVLCEQLVVVLAAHVDALRVRQALCAQSSQGVQKTDIHG